MTRKKQPPTAYLLRSSAAEYLTFVPATGSQQQAVEMRYEDENIWLSQKMMATLYDVTVSAINQHLKRIFADRELVEDAVIEQLLTTAADGKTYNVKHYSLQAIIAVGFKIENERAVQFRKGATQVVKDYTIQGWVMDGEAARAHRVREVPHRAGSPLRERLRPRRGRDRAPQRASNEAHAPQAEAGQEAVTLVRDHAPAFGSPGPEGPPAGQLGCSRAYRHWLGGR